MTNKEQFDHTRYIFEFLGFEYISSIDERNQQPFGQNEKNGYFVHKALIEQTHQKIPYKTQIVPFDWRYVISKNKYQFAHNWTDLMQLIVYLCKKYDMKMYEPFLRAEGYTMDEVFNNLIEEIKYLKQLKQ